MWVAKMYKIHGDEVETHVKLEASVTESVQDFKEI